MILPRLVNWSGFAAMYLRLLHIIINIFIEFNTDREIFKIIHSCIVTMYYD